MNPQLYRVIRGSTLYETAFVITTVLLFFPAAELATEWIAVTGPLRQLFGCLVVGYT